VERNGTGRSGAERSQRRGEEKTEEWRQYESGEEKRERGGFTRGEGGFDNSFRGTATEARTRPRQPSHRRGRGFPLFTP